MRRPNQSKVKVEACWGGHENYYFRLTLAGGQRENVNGRVWTRAIASYAKDMLASLYPINRDSIRFEHH